MDFVVLFLRCCAHVRCCLAVWFGLTAAVACAEEPVSIYPAIAGLENVQSMDVAADGGDLHLLLVGRFSQRAGPSIAYTSSADGGLNWTPPTFIAPAAAPPIARRGNDARLAVRGRRIVAVWQSQGPLPGTGPLSLAVSADGGRTWIPGENPARGDTTQNQSHTAVELDAQGRVHLVWLDDREETGDSQGVRYARSLDGGHHWQPETTLDASACTCCWNTLRVLPDQSIAVLYRDNAPHDMRLVRQPSGSPRWLKPNSVGDFGWDFTGCPHCGGSLAATGSGTHATLHGLVWTGKEKVAGLYHLRSVDGGRHWSAPVKVAGEESRDGDLAADLGTQLGLVFLKRSPTGTEIVYRQSTDQGVHWSADHPLSRPGRPADHPRIAASRRGFRVFWTESVESGGKLLAMAALPETQKSNAH